MDNVQAGPDRNESGSSTKDRRVATRHLCPVKILFNKSKSGEGEITWCVGKVVDLSARGVAVITSRLYFPGTLLTLTPIMPGWKHERQLQARVTNVRQDVGQSWCAGCEFAQPLSEDELQLLLQYSEPAGLAQE